MMVEIPKWEFEERIRRIQAELARRGLDALITYGDEAEPQNVRYLADYWPAFETAGVLVPVEGEPILVIGPESYTYARSRSKIAKIRRVLAYRESSEPEYPGEKLTTFEELFDEASNGRGIERLGLVGYSILPIPIYEGIRNAMKGGEVIRADEILIKMRMIKSENELALHREAYRLSKIGLSAALEKVRPGMTEIEVTSIAREAMMQAGAETEGFPMWCISGPNTNQAISRPTYRKIQKNELVQIQVGARVGGYSSSIGRPFVLGKAPDDVKEFMKVGLEAELATLRVMKAGIPAKEVDRVFRETVRGLGFGDWLLYGPCHGTGLMECEHPWIESNSEWLLEENMVFSVDIFLRGESMGLRFEDGVRVTRDGVEELSDFRREVIEL
ncbi:MAG: aminopeptidase P family protein [Firmicutes bacterium]|nr:aminopeptidase P family protein [Bacillota bacterium]